MATVQDFMRLQRPVDQQVDAKNMLSALGEALANFSPQISYAGLTPDTQAASASRVYDVLNKQQAMLQSAQNAAVQQDSQRFQEAMAAQQAVHAEQQLSLQRAAQAMQAQQHAASMGLQWARFNLERDREAKEKAALAMLFSQLSGQPQQQTSAASAPAVAAPQPPADLQAMLSTPFDPAKAAGISSSSGHSAQASLEIPQLTAPQSQPSQPAQAGTSSQQRNIPSIDPTIIANLPSNIQATALKLLTPLTANENAARLRLQTEQQTAEGSALTSMGVPANTIVTLGGPAKITSNLISAIREAALAYKQVYVGDTDEPLEPALFRNIATNVTKSFFGLNNDAQAQKIADYILSSAIMPGGQPALVQPQASSPTPIIDEDVPTIDLSRIKDAELRKNPYAQRIAR